VARVGCVDVVGGPVRWMRLDEPAGPDRLVVSVGWNPTATRLVLQVSDRTHAHLDLLLADPASGAVEPVFREAGNPWVRRTPLHWIDARRFTWISTRTGWRHLHVHDLDGNTSTALTSGPFEV